MTVVAYAVGMIVVYAVKMTVVVNAARMTIVDFVKPVQIVLVPAQKKKQLGPLSPWFAFRFRFVRRHDFAAQSNRIAVVAAPELVLDRRIDSARDDSKFRSRMVKTHQKFE